MQSLFSPSCFRLVLILKSDSGRGSTEASSHGGSLSSGNFSRHSSTTTGNISPQSSHSSHSTPPGSYPASPRHSVGQVHSQTPPPPPLPSFLVMSNPLIPSMFREMYSWHHLPAADAETATVAEVLSVGSLTGPMATKQRFLKLAPSSQLIHLSTHVSWKVATLVLAPRQVCSHCAPYQPFCVPCLQHESCQAQQPAQYYQH